MDKRPFVALLTAILLSGNGGAVSEEQVEDAIKTAKMIVDKTEDNKRII